MDRAVLDLVAFYRRELRESSEGREALGKLGIESAEVVEHFSLGYCSGRALDAASEEQYKLLVELGLAKKRRERFADCVVIPVKNDTGEFVDLCGLRSYASGLRYVHWERHPRGLIGIEALKAYPEVILCDNAFHALHVRQHGYPNVVALRKVDELKRHLKLFDLHGVQRVYLVSRQQRKLLAPVLRKAGIDVVALAFPSSETVIPKESLEIVGRRPSDAPHSDMKLVARTASHLHFAADGITFKIESVAQTGLGMRVRLKAENSKTSFIDRADIASSAARRKFARACAGKLGVTSIDIEEHLSAIASKIDAMEEEAWKARERAPGVVTAAARAGAMATLKSEDVLAHQAEALEELCGFVAEPENKRLALLVAASRLLDAPLGAVVRGGASSGKSALMQAVARLLPPADVLNLSRLTPQALYFMPAGALEHKLLVCDEYAGMSATEYALRTIMSNQSLSLAITVREGGKLPVTRTVDIPAMLAVLVSTTGSINIENLSRLIEIRMDASPSQTRKVMRAVALSRSEEAAPQELHRKIEEHRDVSRLLRPCTVRVPFAGKLTYTSWSVLARRQFEQVVGLVSAHAALFQFQRDVHKTETGIVVEAEKEDYEAVYPLLGHVVEHFEEEITPRAIELLEVLGRKKAKQITRKEIMHWLGWSYSRAYRTLKELAALDLLVPDTTTNGVLRTYEAAPYFRSERGISRIVPPENL